MNAIELLLAEHREVEVLFSQFKAESDEKVKAGIAHMVCMCLTAHATIEEELFYPAARKVSAETEKLIDEGIQEHAEAKQMIAQIETSSGKQLEDLMTKLEAAVMHHVGEEETELFPKLEKSGMNMDSLGMEMLECKMEVKVELMMK